MTINNHNYIIENRNGKPKGDGILTQTADISSVRRTNFLSVSGYVRKKGSCTIPRIAEDVGLSLPTVTRAVNFALERGIFIPDGMCTAGRGRKAVAYTLNPDFKHCGLLYFFSDTLHCDIYDFKFNCIYSYSCPISDENAVEILKCNVLKITRYDKKISHVLFAVPGHVFDNSILRSWKFPSLNGLNLKEYFSFLENINVIAVNNMFAVTCSSWKYTNDYHSKTVVSYTFGAKKYGAGISVNGCVLSGASGRVCDIGRLETKETDRHSLEFFKEQISGVISVIDPDKIILYPNGECTYEMLSSELCKIYGDDFVQSLVCGTDLYDDCAHGLLRIFNRELKMNYV